MSLFGDDDDTRDDIEEKSAALNAPAVPAPRANADLLAHDGAEKQLLDWWAKGAMPHTLVFAGVPGIGKATLAFRLARFLFTHPDTPGTGLFGAEPLPATLAVPESDPVFQRVASGGHPDLLSVGRTMNEKTSRMHDEVLVDDVRDIPTFLRRTAADGGWRVVVVDDAESLNRNAQNALLKILEEPPPRALLILITQAAGALIPTIRSRARVMNLSAPPAPAFAGLMRRYRPDLTAGDIDLLGQVAANAPGRALALLEQGGMAAISNTVDMLDNLPAAPDQALWTMAEKLAVRGEPDPLMGMLDVSGWALRMRATAAAEKNETGAMKNYLSTLDALERHRAACDKGNLDRRHTALGALRILQSGMRAA